MRRRIGRRFNRTYTRPALKPVRRAIRHPKPRVNPVLLRGRTDETYGIGTVRIAGGNGRPLRSFRINLVMWLAILLFVISAFQNLQAVNETGFHPDETRWVNRAHYFGDLLDPFGQNWEDSYLNRGQPPLGNYLMGLGLLLQGRDLDTNRIWGFWYDEEWNEATGAIPVDADYLAARRTNAIVGALVVVVVFFVTLQLTNLFGAFLGAFFLIFQRLHIILASQALSDQLLALCLALSFLAAAKLARHRTWRWALFLGFVLGLGGATKLAPLLLSFPVAGVGVIWLVDHYGRKIFRPGMKVFNSFGFMMLIQPLIAFASFVAVSPFLWPDPIRRTYYLFEFRRDEMNSQSSIWTNTAVNSPLEAMQRIGRSLNTDWTSSTQIQLWFQQHTGFSWTPVGFDLVLVAIGGLLLVMAIIRQGIYTPLGLASVLIGAELGAVLVGMKTDFYRYNMPVVVIDAVLMGYFFGCLYQSRLRGWGLWLLDRLPGIRISGVPARKRRSPRMPVPKLKPRYSDVSRRAALDIQSTSTSSSD